MVDKFSKTALVAGSGGFIGSHLVTRLKNEGYYVRGVDLKYPEFSKTKADQFVIGDLRSRTFVSRVINNHGHPFDEIYVLAAAMGGAGWIFTGEHDAEILNSNATIHLNFLDCVQKFNDMYGHNRTKMFYSSSACIYPAYNQMDPDNPICSEESAYPADPDSDYGFEKLFSERLYLAYNRNYDIPVRIARLHNIYGIEGTWQGGREKAPAAICRKVALSTNGTIEVWGDGEQTRSFLYIDECIEAVRRLMESEFIGPINIGSEESVTINQLVQYAADVAGKDITPIHIPGPLGVRGRNSDNALVRDKLGWDYSLPLINGISKTYQWIDNQIKISE